MLNGCDIRLDESWRSCVKICDLLPSQLRLLLKIYDHKLHSCQSIFAQPVSVPALEQFIVETKETAHLLKRLDSRLHRGESGRDQG